MAVLVTDGQSVTTNSGPWSSAEWTGTGSAWGSDHPLLDFFRTCQYEELYETQPSVNKVIDKRARLQGLVPFNAHRETARGSLDATRTNYGRLVAKPCGELSQFEYRDWHFHTKDIQGITFGAIIRDDPERLTGGVVEVPPLHPMRMRFGPSQDKGTINRKRLTAAERASGKLWWFVVNESTEVHFPRRDLFIWKNFHPRKPHWGHSKLEALRSTLEDDAAARCAMEAMWKRGARPHYVIKATDNMGDHPSVVQQVKDDAAAVHGGVGNWWKPLVLDGGMDITELRTEDGLEYLGLRKLTDVEVGAVYDLSGPVIHNLERATFNNIYELFQDVFRSSIGIEFRSFEAAWDNDVRDGSHGELVAPNFPEGFTAKFNTKAVLRGSPDKQIAAYSQQIQTGQRTSNEIREYDDLPPMPGGDVLLINAALVPIEMAGESPSSADTDSEAGATPPAGTLALGGGPVLELGAGGLSGREAAASVYGRLGRVEAVADIDVPRLVEGLSDGAAEQITAAVTLALVNEDDVAALRDTIRGLEL